MQPIMSNAQKAKYKEQNYPLQAMINDYLLNIFVVKKHEIRMYDLEKGSLSAIHNRVFEDLDKAGDITKFRIDRRHRKAYVASNTGHIIVINCQSGVKIKNATQYLQDKAEIKRAELEEKLAKNSGKIKSDVKSVGFMSGNEEGSDSDEE